MEVSLTQMEFKNIFNVYLTISVNRAPRETAASTVGDFLPGYQERVLFGECSEFKSDI